MLSISGLRPVGFLRKTDKNRSSKKAMMVGGTRTRWVFEKKTDKNKEREDEEEKGT